MVALLAFGLLAKAAAADTPLDAARAAVDASDYFAARTQLDAIVTAGTSGPDELAEVYRLTGIVAGALGDAKAATTAFQKCLALSPKVTLPVGTSPKIGRPFAAAQAFFKTHEAVKIKADTAASPPAVTISVVSDPLAMIARARVYVRVDGKPEETLERPAADSVTLTLPEGQRIDLRIAALDANGNRVAELGTAEVPIVIVGAGGTTQVTATKPVVKPPPRPASPAHARPLYLKWWLWGGVTVAFAGAGTYFGFAALSAKSDLDALNAASQQHTFDEAKALESTARRDVLFTNIGLGAAAAFGVATVILYLTDPRAPASEQQRTTSVTPTVLPGGGAGLVLGGQF